MLFAFIILFFESQAYRLKDDDVVVVNGVIVNCVYDISTKGNVIEIPDVLDNQTVTGIGDYAFSIAGKIAILTLPSTLKTIGYGVFEGHALTSLVIPDGVTSIGGRAFYGNALASINLPAGLETIADQTFANNQLTSITLPAGLKNIGWGAFQNNKIGSLTIPNSVETIGGWAFSVNRITTLNFEPVCKLKELPYYCFSGNDIKSVTIPNSILQISDGAFSSNQNLKNVTFGSGLLKIKRSAFSGCNISALNLPGSLVFIGKGAFDGNFNLNSFKLPVSANNYQWNDSNGDKHNAGSAVTEKYYSYVAIIPYTLTNADVEVVNGVISYCSYFSDISHLGTVITIPDNLDGQKIIGIGENVFYDKGISEITLPNGVSNIGRNAFGYNEIINLTIPASLSTIGTEAFYWNCINKLTFEPSSQLTTIGLNAFTSNRITNIIFPQSVIKIEKYAFQGNFIQNIQFEPNSKLVSIGSYAFMNNSLTSFTLPDPKANSYEYWVDWDNKQYSTNRVVTNFESFYKIPIEYTLTNADVEVVNGVIVSYTPTNLYANILTIPETLDGQKIIGIGNSVFQSTGIIGVNLPASLQTIYFNAFAENDLLKVTIPANVTKIEGQAFYWNNINELNFEPNSKLDRIEWGAFYINRIASLVLPNDLTYIDNYAFGSNRIANSQKIPDGVEYIGWGAFSYNRIPAVIFGDNSVLSYLGTYAFAGNLISNEIKIPKTLTEISDYAFQDNQISKVIVHDRIVDYGTGAFQYNNPSLKIVLHEPPTIPFVTHFFGWKDSNGVYHYPGETITDFSIRYKAVIDQFFVVKFIVKDDNNIPVEDASIQFYNDLLETDVNGIDSIGPVMRGLQNYKISAAGCYGDDGNVDVQDNMTVLITLVRYYNLTVKVVDINDNPVNGAAVNINGKDLTADSKGTTNISLPDGDYPFKINSIGYNELSSSAIVLDADNTVVVKLVRVSVNYFPNQGDGNAYSEITFGNSYQTDNNTFTRQAYTFSHWNTSDDNSGDKYGENATMTLAYSDIDLYAIWKPVNYNINYHLDGGTNASGNPSTYNIENEVNFLPASKPSLYFATWLDADSNRVARIDKGTTGDIELWAVFTTEPTYFIDYYNVENAKHKNLSAYTKFDLPFAFTDAKKAGYPFEGWFEDNLLTKKITSIPDGSKKDYDVYAKWGAAINFQINYELGGGTNNLSNPSSYTIESSPIQFASPSKTGANFIAWYSDNSLTKLITNIPSGSAGDTTIYAKWVLDTFAIQYVLNGGVNHPLNPEEFTIESEKIQFESPTKPGADFKGWYKEKEFTNKITEIPRGSIGDREIYAKWELTGYQINYELDGGINNPVNPLSYSIESSLIQFASPSKTGAKFIAWFSDNSLTKKVTEIPSGSTGDTTIYAKWELDTFAIQYVLNGGVNHPLNPEEFTIESEKIQFESPTKPGADFKGWYREKEFTNKITELPTGSVGDREIYAKWELTGYRINYELAGGTNHPANPLNYTIESSMIQFASPSKTGAKFISWFSDNSLTKKITQLPSGSTGDTTIYAKWELDTFAIQYVLNGGVNHPLNPEEFTIESDKIQFESPTKPGADFKGWYREKEFTNKITELPTGSVGDREIYAKWELTGYQINYELAGGTNHPANPLNYTIESSMIQFASPSKTGAKFISWFSDNSLTKKITQIPSGSTGDTTIYAKWELDTFAIQYVLNGGVNHPLNPVMYTVESDDIEFEKPEKEGFFFAGWYSNPVFTEEISLLAKGSIGDKTVYAKWLEIFSLNFIITTDSINPATDIEVLINKDKKMTSDELGIADTLLPDGSSIEYTIQMNGIEVTNGSVTISGSDTNVEIAIIDCYLRWWDVLFCNNDKGLWTNFEWYKNGSKLAFGETQFLHDQGGIKTGDYKLVVTAINGNKYVWEKTFDSEFPWKKLLEADNGYLLVFPSPATRGKEISICLSEAINLNTSVIYIYDFNGRLIQSIDGPLYINKIFSGELFSSGRYQVVLYDKINGIYETKELVVY